jgi:hypothetical protein
MKFILLLTMTFTFAKAPEQRTPSENQCVNEAEAKRQIVKNSQCKWKVTKQEYPDKDPLSISCSGYNMVGKKKVPKKTTYSGSGHAGTLYCGHSGGNSIDTSYQQSVPNFSFQCSQCSTSSEAETPDETCIETMYKDEVAACDGNPRMNYRHEIKQSIRIDGNGNVIQGDIIK